MRDVLRTNSETSTVVVVVVVSVVAAAAEAPHRTTRHKAFKGTPNIHTHTMHIVHRICTYIYLYCVPYAGHNAVPYSIYIYYTS